MKIYAISLKHQNDRQVVLKQYFDNIEFVDAIDKVNIKKKTKDSDYLYENLTYTSDLKNGEIACFLSHQKVWTMISNSINDDWVLVLEDDAKPKKDWNVRLDEGIKEIPEQYGIVYLGGARKTTIPKTIEKRSERNLKKINWKFHEEKSLGKYTELCNPVLQTHAYLIKPSTARHLLNSIKTIEYPIDYQWWLYGVGFARFKKALIVQNRIFKSTIQ